MDKLYAEACLKSSKVFTNTYSTSFSLGIKMLDKSIHDPIYAIYGFVRLADEIVDTFHSLDKEKYLNQFKKETYEAIENGFSLNPILESFQAVVNNYDIEKEHIAAFLYSMELDLNKIEYTQEEYEEYIYGSAEVVGLMCLKVFCKGQKEDYNELESYAKSLGSAFQKINFLRDIKADFQEKGRTYFPNIDLEQFTQEQKQEIEKDITKDFADGFKGIKKLPSNAKFGVYTAYLYYIKLLQKIQSCQASTIKNQRIRVKNSKKYILLLKSYILNKLGLI